MKSSITDLPAAGLSRIAANPVGAMLLRLAGDVVRSDITDRSMTLAAQMFTSLLPVIILMSTLPGSEYVETTLQQLSLSKDDLAIPPTVPSTTSFATFGVVGAIMTVASATSFSRAINRMYASVWQVPRLRLSDWWRWLSILALVASAMVAQGYVLVLKHTPTIGFVLMIPLTFLTWTLCWWAVAKVSVKSFVSGRRLSTTGALTGLGLTVLITGSTIAMPRIVRSAVSEFGTLGLVFTAISWLLMFFYVVVTAAVVAHAIAPGDKTPIVGKPTLLQQFSAPSTPDPTDPPQTSSP